MGPGVQSGAGYLFFNRLEKAVAFGTVNFRPDISFLLCYSWQKAQTDMCIRRRLYQSGAVLMHEPDWHRRSSRVLSKSLNTLFPFFPFTIPDQLYIREPQQQRWFRVIQKLGAQERRVVDDSFDGVFPV